MMCVEKLSCALDNDEVNTLYLRYLIPQTIYQDIISNQRLQRSFLLLHDWSSVSSVPIQIFLKLMNMNSDDGTPDIAFEYNRVQMQYVTVACSVFPYQRFCVDCFNTNIRLRFATQQSNAYVVQDIYIIPGYELLNFLQGVYNWCSCCVTMPLFKIQQADTPPQSLIFDPEEIHTYKLEAITSA